MDECKWSGQIPPFGNWDYANELPITQYFESARQAGLLRHSSFSGECGPHMAGDLYAVDLKKPSRAVVPPRKQTTGREKRYPHVKEHKKQGKVCDVMDLPQKIPIKPLNQLMMHNDTIPVQQHNINHARRPPKAVDEDLYKIPPDLLRTAKRKKRLGFFSRCLVPACAA